MFFALTLQSSSMIQAYRLMEMTRERISFTFDPKDMLLSLQMGFSFVRAAVACAILERTSGLEPSSETTAPRYLKLVTVPNFCTFTCISHWMPLALFVISLVFSALISILYLVQVLLRLSTRSSSSCCSSARASMSSANRRLLIFLPPMLTFPSCSSRVSPDHPLELSLFNIRSTLVISTSVISNNRLSRRENLVLVLIRKSKIKLQNIVEKRRNCSWGAISPLFHNIFNIYF